MQEGMNNGLLERWKEISGQKILNKWKEQDRIRGYILSYRMSLLNAQPVGENEFRSRWFQAMGSYPTDDQIDEEFDKSQDRIKQIEKNCRDMCYGACNNSDILNSFDCEDLCDECNLDNDNEFYQRQFN